MEIFEKIELNGLTPDLEKELLNKDAEDVIDYLEKADLEVGRINAEDISETDLEDTAIIYKIDENKYLVGIISGDVFETSMHKAIDIAQVYSTERLYKLLP